MLSPLDIQLFVPSAQFPVHPWKQKGDATSGTGTSELLRDAEYRGRTRNRSVKLPRTVSGVRNAMTHRSESARS
jgi:hypothetical protein